MRGSISYINKRYSKAQKEYCSDYDSKKPKTYITYSDYDSKKPKKYITYFDMNNLYGYAMSRCIPYVNFKWVKNINEIEQKLVKIKRNSSTGYILAVDLEYLEKLHYEHNDYPLAPEKINIQKEWLSDYCLEIANGHNIIVGSIKN